MERKERWIEYGFLFTIFVFYFLWAYVQPFNVSPDESMRYDIARYIYEHGTLPHGGDPEIRNEIWGQSYAFMPILSYMISAVFMRAAAAFSTDPFFLLMAARMVSVLFGVMTVWMAILIAKKIIVPPYRRLFILLVAFLPQQIFVSSYVNNDAMAIFSTAMIVYMWILALESGWGFRSCVGLAAGVSLCALSYYNAYGFILCSMLLFGVSLLLARKDRKQWTRLLRRAALMIAIVVVCIGWWFARNYILYDGDILGMKTSEEYAQMYARDDLKPSNIVTPQKKGESLFHMLFVEQWLYTAGASFIGCFGYLSCPLKWWMYGLYLAVVGVGLLGILLGARRMFQVRARQSGSREKDGGGEETKAPGQAANSGQGTCWLRCDYPGDVRLEGVFHWIMLVALVIPNVLNLYYSYAVDYQPQGRYSLPMLIPLMYFMTEGIIIFLEKAVKNRQAQRIAASVICVIVLLVGITSFTHVFLPLYQ